MHSNSGMLARTESGCHTCGGLLQRDSNMPVKFQFSVEQHAQRNLRSIPGVGMVKTRPLPLLVIEAEVCQGR